MKKRFLKVLAITLSLGMLFGLFAIPMSVNATPPAGETYDDYDVITYGDLLDTGNNHLSASGKELTAQNNIFHYSATSESHSVIYKFRYVAGAVVYFQMFPGAYRSNDPFAYRIKDATTYEKRYSPNSGTTGTSTISEGDTIDFEIARLLVTGGDNAGKYYTYLKANGSTLFEAYATTDQISGTDLDDSIQFNLNGSNSCTIMATPAVVEQEPADALYYYYDEIGYADLLDNGNPVGEETTLGSKLFTYNATANTYSVILKYRWKAVATTKFQISFDRKGSDNAINYMFGAQLYVPGSEGHTNSSLRLRPGLDDANAWRELPENIADGAYYDVEFARLKVKNGENAGKYYVYFKLNDVMISESYVAANVVDSEGNYTSNPGATACHLSNEIYITHWGGGNNDKWSAIPEPETYEDYDVVTYYDLLLGGNPLTAERTAISGNPKFAYNRTSATYSVIFKYRWTAGSYTTGKPYYVFYYDKWSGDAYPFCLAVKSPGYSGLGAAAGENGAWHLVPNNASNIVQMSEPIVAGNNYDIEHGRVMVATGPNAGKFYVYVKVNGELICGYYYDGDNGDGTYGKNKQAYDPSYLRFTDGTSDNYISAIPEPEYYEDYDEVYYSNLYKNGDPVSNEGSGSGSVYTYNRTSDSYSAILKFRWKNANPETQAQISFDRKGSDNAINYMFGMQIYKPDSDHPNGRVWLRPGYGPSVDFTTPIQSGENYDIEFARLKVATGRNAGKYYIYLKINDELIASDYVAANVVDSEGNYTSSPSSTACHLSNEMYITFWGGGGATITNPAFTETYCEYDDIGYSDLSVDGNPVAANKRNMSGGTVLTYNRTSDTGSVVFKYRWKVGDVAKFQMSFDEKASTDRSNMEYMFGAWLSGPSDNYANGDMYLRPSYGSHKALDAALTPGGVYDIEYGRLKVASGPNKDKYYVYIKIDDVLIDESYVAANVVDSEGNYTTKPGDVQCNVKAGQIFMAFWGTNGNMIGVYGGVAGDLNDDFVVDGSDMVILRKVLLGYEEVSYISVELADFNSDSIVDICDYVSMKKSIAA